jgi:PAS domain S-box-containing protein
MRFTHNTLTLGRAALVAGFVLLELSGAGALWSIGSLRDALERQDRAQAAIDAAERAIHDLRELEMELLRFVASGQPANRSAIAQDVKNLRASMDAFERGLDESVRSRSMPELRLTIDAYVGVVEGAAEARRDRGRDAVLGELAGSTWRARVAEIEETIRRLKSETVGVEHAASAAAAQTSGHRVTTWVLGGSAAATFCLILAVLLMRLARRERAEFERQLRRSDKQFRALLESAPDAMVVSDSAGEIKFVNAQAERLFGYTRAELLGQNVKMLVPERSHAAHAALRAELLAGSRVRLVGSDFKTYAKRKDGSEFPTEVSFSPVFGESMIVSETRDATERKRATETSRARERFIRTITDQIPAGVVYADRDERVRFANRAFGEWMGASADQLEGRTLREAVGEGPYEFIREKVAQVNAGETVRFERTHRAPVGGKRDLVVTLMPDRDAKGEVVGHFTFIEDVTETKRVARLKNEFVSTVSHELRTPLTSIRGSLGLLEGGAAGELGARAKNLVSLARQNCDRLVRLINDILDMEKIEAGRMVFDMKPLVLTELVEEAVAANEGYAREHATRFVVKAACDGSMVLGDKDRLMQVMTNLLSNAAKFTPSGADVEVAVQPHGSRIRVSVIDHGPGIPQEFQSRIFEKFSQADSSDTRKKGGSGLGLAISKAIVERHGGLLDFATRSGEGTSFYFELPAMADRRKGAQGPRAEGEHRRVLVYASEPESGRLLAEAISRAGFQADMTDSKEGAERLIGARRYDALALPGAEAELLRDVLVEATPHRPASILHIEDDAGLREVIAQHLERLGKIDGAATLAEARERLAHEHYDLLLLDIGLPDGSAWALVEELRAKPSWPRIVVFSGQAVAPERMAQVSAVLQKSRDSEARLVDTVRNLLAQTTPGGGSDD